MKTSPPSLLAPVPTPRPARVLALTATLSLAFCLGSGLLHAGPPPVPAKQPILAPDLPAVSALNGKFEGFYGDLNDTSSRGVAGSLSLPITHSLGAQLDALYSHTGESDFYGAGGHLFTRHPESYLLGLFAGGVYSSNSDNILAAVEGEYYWGRLTLGALGGYNYLDTDLALPLFNPDLATRHHFAFVKVYAAIYPVDDLMVRLGYTNRIERNFYSLELEYQTPIRGLALFVDGSVGDNDYHHILGGIRYYFGGSKTLKDRHRQDDPPNPLGVMTQTSQLTQSGIRNGPLNPGGGPPPPPPPQP